MNLWILNDEFQQVGLVDDYKSLIWSKRYNEIGDCEIYIGANDRTIGLLQKGNYVLRDDDDMICRIESVELDTDVETGDYLIVSGYDCRKILNQRIVWSQTNYKGTVENFIRKIINDNVINPSLARRRISNFRLGNGQGFRDAIEIQSTYDYLFDKIKELCATYNYGSKVTFDGENFVFDLYRGTNRSTNQDENDVVIFSPEFENLISSKYKSDSTLLKTSVLIAGEGEGLDRVCEEIVGDSGLNRHELFVDAKDVSSEISYEDLVATYPNGHIIEDNAIVYYVVDGERIAILNHIDTPTSGNLLGEPYKILLRQKGVESLAETKIVITFDGEVEPNYSYKFGVDYFLGDIVTVQNEYGIGADARVIEVIENDDENGYSIIPTFEYIESNEPTFSLAALSTEDYEPLLTEDYEYLVPEEAIIPFANTNSTTGIDAVKISQLPNSTDVYEGCCMPIVTNGETKKVTYGLLKDKLTTSIEHLTNTEIENLLT